jgi:hypothetical protein
MQSQTGQDTQRNTKLILLYLFKCLDSKKLYFRVEVRGQIHTCIPVPKKSNIKKSVAIQPVAIQPVAIQPVAIQPVAIQPVAIQPVAIQPVAIQPVAIQTVVV